MCSLAYVLLLDELHRQVATAQTSAVMQRALGADVEIPDWFAIRAQFDTGLAVAPVDESDDDRLVLMKALGLR